MYPNVTKTQFSAATRASSVDTGVDYIPCSAGLLFGAGFLFMLLGLFWQRFFLKVRKACQSAGTCHKWRFLVPSWIEWHVSILFLQLVGCGGRSERILYYPHPKRRFQKANFALSFAVLFRLMKCCALWADRKSFLWILCLVLNENIDPHQAEKAMLVDID